MWLILISATTRLIDRGRFDGSQKGCASPAGPYKWRWEKEPPVSRLSGIGESQEATPANIHDKRMFPSMTGRQPADDGRMQDLNAFSFHQNLDLRRLPGGNAW